MTDGEPLVDAVALEDVARRVLSMPPRDQEDWFVNLERARREVLPSDEDKLRAFAQEGEDGLLRWADEACGAVMHHDLRRELLHLERNRRVALVAATGIGKSHGIAIWLLYHFCCVAQIERDGAKLGCIILLAAPAEHTLRQTLWERINAVVLSLESRGYALPPGKNFKTIEWVVPGHAGWFMSIVRPPQRRNLEVAATLRGRHGSHMIAAIDEAMGLADRPDVFNALDDGFGGKENRIIFAMNPDPKDATGPAYERCRNGTYAVLHRSALDFPNVRYRREEIPGGATHHQEIDAAIRFECHDRGLVTDVELDPERHDFVYALPTKGVEDVSGVREDGVLGSPHPSAEPRVYRPKPRFIASRLGQFVKGDPGISPFSRSVILECVRRWMSEDDLRRPPDRVGVDPNRGGKDGACHVPAWGPAAATILEQLVQYREVVARGDEVPEKLLPQYVRVGELRQIPDHLVKGFDVAGYLHATYPAESTVFVVDTNGVGASVGDSLEAMGRVVASVEGPTAAEDPVEGEEPCVDKRTQGVLRLALLAQNGLVDLPPTEIDGMLARPSLAQQMLAVRRDDFRGGNATTRIVNVNGRKVQRQVAKLEAKEKMKANQLGGHSPDELDTVVLAACWESWTGTSFGYVVHA